MSSNRTAVPFEAALYRDDKPVGPIRLPMKQKIAFAREFNRVYRSTGLELETFAQESVAAAENSEATENSDSNCNSSTTR